MTAEVISKKRAARIERRKNKIAAIFNVKEVFKFETKFRIVFYYIISLDNQYDTD